MIGGMQDWPLRIMRLLDHAEREHGQREIVSRWAAGNETRTNWAGVARDARKLAAALERLGIRKGDRVATLAMNHSRHLVSWYGTIGMGGIIHTINPRLFDDMAAAQVEEAAKAGGCGLLNVELDRRPGEEAPRVTIRSIQSFENLSKRTRLQLQVEVDGPEVLPRLAEAVADHRGGNGQLRLRVKLDDGDAELLLGRDFVLDAELGARIERIDGVSSVRLSVAEPPRLALVS